MYGCELDYKESWTLKNWCLWTVVLEKTLQSPLDCKEIQPVRPKGDQTSPSWRKSVLNIHWKVDDGIEAPILWPPDMKNWLIGKDPDAGKDWRQEEKGTTEDGMVGWHHRLDREAWHAVVHGVVIVGHDWATELNWTDVLAFVDSAAVNVGVHVSSWVRVFSR